MQREGFRFSGNCRSALAGVQSDYSKKIYQLPANSSRERADCDRLRWFGARFERPDPGRVLCARDFFGNTGNWGGGGSGLSVERHRLWGRRIF